MVYDVFISHASEDKDIAAAIVSHFEAEGLRCWIAPRDIQPGLSWASAIVQGINASRAMVLVFSSHTQTSDYVLNEVSLALGGKMPMVPFRIEEVEPEGDYKFYLHSRHWFDAWKTTPNTYIPKLLDTTRGILGIEVSEIEVTSDQPTKKETESHAHPQSDDLSENTTMTSTETSNQKPIVDEGIQILGGNPSGKEMKEEAPLPEYVTTHRRRIWPPLLVGVAILGISAYFIVEYPSKPKTQNPIIQDGLMWQNEPYSEKEIEHSSETDGGFGKTQKWPDALKYCKDLDLYGHKDWRLPSKEELVKFSSLKIQLNIDLYNVWTSTEFEFDDNLAMLVSVGTAVPFPKSLTALIRCVREKD